MTPLHGAVYSENYDTVELLLNSGANINVKNDFGETELDMAKRIQHEEITNLLKNKYEHSS